ncbi:MAG TPA: lamin tail domain-containing protein [bacterium]|nr:lamin tail domain-containing protein [bacterium]
MRRPVAFLIATLCCYVACEKFSLPKDEYTYFEVIASPEERVWYPEETLSFTFSAALDTGSLGDAVTIAYEGDPVNTTAVTADGDRLLVNGLLPDATLTITIESALKSADHQPLVAKNDEGYGSEPQVFTFTIGPAFPSVATVIPGDDLRSENIAISFTGPVDTAKMIVTPKPVETVAQDGGLLLSFSTAPTKLTIAGLASPLRPGTVPDITLSFNDSAPASAEPTVTETLFDTAVSFTIEGDGLVAAALDNELAVCDGDCTLTRDGLEAGKEYSFDLVLYRTDGVTTVTRDVSTLPPTPHIMLSEVMHTPAGEPEKNWEFVEIYNYGTLDFDLTTCTLDDRADGAGEDPLVPLVEGDVILKPGEYAIILGSESTLHLTIDTDPHVYFVDDTTLADGGLTSTESVQINCIVNEAISREAFYDGLFKGTDRGYSVVIDTYGRVCASAEQGGTPGAAESCPE